MDRLLTEDEADGLDQLSLLEFQDEKTARLVAEEIVKRT